jgi:hypothetical protein
LDEAARASGRTQSKEAELRLENSFRDEGREPMLLASIYGHRLARLLTALGNVMQAAGTAAAYGERRTDLLLDWTDDREAVREAVLALRTVLSDIDDSPLPDARESVGVSMAYMMIGVTLTVQEGIEPFRPSKTKETRRG